LALFASLTILANYYLPLSGALCLQGSMAVDSIKNLFLKYLPEILLLVLLVLFYLHNQETREILYLLQDTIELMDSSETKKYNGDWRYLIGSLDKNITQISVFFIFFIGIFNLSRRKHNKSLKQDF